MYKILSGQWITQIFDRALSLGLIWGFSGESAATLSSLFIAIGALPHLLFSAFAARMINKHGHKKVMLQTEILRFLLLVGFYFLYKTISHAFFETYLVFVLAFLLNTFAAFYNPAVLSSPRFFVKDEEVERTTSLINTGFSLSNIVGPLLFSFLFTKGMDTLLLAAAISYFVSALLVFKLENKKLELNNENNVDAKIFSLPRLILNLLVVFAFMNIFLGPLQIFIPLFAKETAGGIKNYASFEFLLALGLLLGSFSAFLPQINNIKDKRPLLGLLFWILALGYLIFSLVHQSAWAYSSLFVMGLSLGLANVLLMSYFQLAVSLNAVPALMAAVNLISTASLPLSMSLSALVLGWLSTDVFAVFCSVFLIIMVLLFQLKLASSDGFKRGVS